MRSIPLKINDKINDNDKVNDRVDIKIYDKMAKMIIGPRGNYQNQRANNTFIRTILFMNKCIMTFQSLFCCNFLLDLYGEIGVFNYIHLLYFEKKNISKRNGGNK